MDNMKIGNFIAECRKERKITQQNLADMLNITNKAVSKWENGYGLPDITILTELAKILGVTVDEILNGERKEVSVTNNADVNRDTADKSINKDSDTVMRYLVQKAIDKFQLMALVSIILSGIGVITQYIIWSETKDLTGWFFGCWLNICGGGIYYYYYRLMKNQVREYNITTAIKIDATETGRRYFTPLCVIWGFMLLTIIAYFI